MGIFDSLNLGMNRGDDRELVTENWSRFLESAGITQKEFVCGRQVHGSYVHIATEADLRPAYGPGELIDADGYATNLPGVPLAIFTADCVPLLMQDPVHGVIAAVHSGWRSTAADIEESAITAMVKLGAVPSDIRVAIGPAIDRCCFEVGPEVVEAMDALLAKGSATAATVDEPMSADTVAAEASGALAEKEAAGASGAARQFYEARGEKYMLDLRGVIRKRLLQLGVAPSHLELVGPCTMCHPELFWSHRYTHGERGSQANVIMM